MSKSPVSWVTRWGGIEVSAEPILPGVYRRRHGGHVVRGSAKDPNTGRLTEVFRVLADVRDPKEAMAWLTRERASIRAGAAHEEKTRPPRLHAYAASLLERKIDSGDIVSEAGKEKWAGVLAHLFDAPFADFYLDAITPADVRVWRDKLPTLTWERTKKVRHADGSERDVGYKSGKYRASVLNSWLSILRVIIKAAVVDHDLARDPMLGIRNFPVTSRYTEEEPNALSPEENEVSSFLTMLNSAYPQHYVMALLGFVIGQRPSTLRPLRRSGAESDLKFNDDGTATILLRRSNSRGQVVTDRARLKTKESKTPKLLLPHDIAKVLKDHIKKLDADPVTAKSDLLFPSPTTGRMRSRSSLDIPFAKVAKLIGLTKRITPGSMRRTFKDMSRAVGIEAVVRKAVSGHATDAMDTHYSTAHKPEVARALSNLYELATARAKRMPRKKRSGA
jgi:hypothetical protein